MYLRSTGTSTNGRKKENIRKIGSHKRVIVETQQEMIRKGKTTEQLN